MKSILTLLSCLIVPVALHAQITDTGGNVGIGTTTPTSKLEVNGDVRSSSKYIITGKGSLESPSGTNLLLYGNSSLFLAGGGGGTNHMTITNTGNIGIGTTTPTAKLDVSGDVRSTGKYIVTGVGTFEPVATNSILVTANNDLRFAAGGSATPQLTILGLNGRVGINATNLTHRLTVGGGIGAQEVEVTVAMGSDFVFNDDYKLTPLSDVEKFIKDNHHLPNVASAKEMETNGIELGKMDMKLLEKIEELTLYMIELKKENQVLREEINQLKQK
jgi:hypothetical protein